jgi:hypothetical protein
LSFGLGKGSKPKRINSLGEINGLGINVNGLGEALTCGVANVVAAASGVSYSTRTLEDISVEDHLFLKVILNQKSRVVASKCGTLP